MKTILSLALLLTVYSSYADEIITAKIISYSEIQSLELKKRCTGTVEKPRLILKSLGPKIRLKRMNCFMIKMKDVVVENEIGELKEIGDVVILPSGADQEGSLETQNYIRKYVEDDFSRFETMPKFEFYYLDKPIKLRKVTRRFGKGKRGGKVLLGGISYEYIYEKIINRGYMIQSNRTRNSGTWGVSR